MVLFILHFGRVLLQKVYSCFIIVSLTYSCVILLPFFLHWCTHRSIQAVTGQFADKPTRGQSSCGLVNSRTTQLTEMFDL